MALKPAAKLKEDSVTDTTNCLKLLSFSIIQGLAFIQLIFEPFILSVFFFSGLKIFLVSGILINKYC